VNRRGALVALVALVVPGGGCLATRPYVRSTVHQELQMSDTQSQQQLRAVDHRLDMIERDLGEQRARLTRLDGDVHQVQMAVQDALRQGAETRELAVKAEGRARDALRAVSSLQAVSSAPAVSAPPARTAEPVVEYPETLIVYFGSADWLLDNAARLTLERALKRLRENPTLKVKLEGHSDSRGPSSQNLKLSQRRADEVWRFLVTNGVKRSRIEAQSIGEAQPAASNTSPQGRDQNRRVAITLAPVE
jgi:outer membrane protein OmpA-like peptidoglycan-associated protein